MSDVMSKDTFIPFWSKEAAEIARNKLERTGLYICALVFCSCSGEWLLDVVPK